MVLDTVRRGQESGTGPRDLAIAFMACADMLDMEGGAAAPGRLRMPPTSAARRSRYDGSCVVRSHSSSPSSPPTCATFRLGEPADRPGLGRRSTSPGVEELEADPTRTSSSPSSSRHGSSRRGARRKAAKARRAPTTRKGVRLGCPDLLAKAMSSVAARRSASRSNRCDPLGRGAPGPSAVAS